MLQLIASVLCVSFHVEAFAVEPWSVVLEVDLNLADDVGELELYVFGDQRSTLGVAVERLVEIYCYLSFEFILVPSVNKQSDGVMFN